MFPFLCFVGWKVKMLRSKYNTWYHQCRMIYVQFAPKIRQQSAAPDCTCSVPPPSLMASLPSGSSPAQALKFNAKRQMRHARQGEPLKMDSIRHLTAGTWYGCEWIRTPKTTVTATSWCTFIWKCDISGGGGTHQTFSFRSISISLATFFCDLNWV